MTFLPSKGESGRCFCRAARPGFALLARLGISWASSSSRRLMSPPTSKASGARGPELDLTSPSGLWRRGQRGVRGGLGQIIVRTYE